METISVDIGYSYTKTHKMLIFPTRVQKDGDMLLGSEVIYKGQKYCVGFGRPEYELNKIKSDVMKICGLYAICKTTLDNDIILITGLPIGQYQSQKQALRESFLHDTTITVAGTERTLKIHDVKIYPQGAGALHSAKIEGDCILVDIGGMSVDIAYFQVQNDGRRTLKKHKSLYNGVIFLNDKVINAINSKFDLGLKLEDAERIIKNGLYINGVKQDLGFTKSIIFDHILELKDELTLNYPVSTTKVYLCGGGAYLYKNVLGYEILENSQFANAIGGYRMGVI